MENETNDFSGIPTGNFYHIDKETGERHRIKTGDAFQFEGEEKSVLEKGECIHVENSGDSFFFGSKGVTCLGPLTESPITTKDFKMLASRLSVVLATYSHRRWTDLTLGEQAEIAETFSDLGRMHELLPEKLAEFVGREILDDVFKRSVQHFACLKDDDTE